MNPLKVKTAIIVCILLVVVGFITVGCRPKPKNYGVINTSSLPGNTFTKHKEVNNSKIVYLGNQNSSSDEYFGPRDISFDFGELRR